MSNVPHTCTRRSPSTCEACLHLEVALWDAINRYAVTVGGDPSQHVYGNVPRMQAVADVGQILADDRAQAPSDHAHLQRLYAESRTYIRDLVDERDALVEAARRDVAESDRLTAEVDRLTAEVAALRGGGS